MLLKNILTTTFLIANALFINAQTPLAGKWPPIDVPPPFQDSWKTLVDISKLPKAPVSAKFGDCPNPDTFCSWTCTRCLKPEDISFCPKVKDWAFTFDDGPTNNTIKLLDFLDTKNMKVTFFVVGSRVINNPEILKRAITAGHQIGVHTWSHTPLTTQTSEQIISEIKWTELAIQQAGGITPNILRPPQGDTDDRVRAISTALGYRQVLWDLDPLDWQLILDPTHTDQQVYDNFTQWASNTTATTGHISLQHDLYERNVNLVPKIVEIVTGKGFNTTTVGGCLNLPLHNPLNNTVTKKRSSFYRERSIRYA